MNNAEDIDLMAYNSENDSVIPNAQFPISFESFSEGFPISVWSCHKACFYSPFDTLLDLCINERQVNIFYIRMVFDDIASPMIKKCLTQDKKGYIFFFQNIIVCHEKIYKRAVF